MPRKHPRRKLSPPEITCDEAPCPKREIGTPCHIWRFIGKSCRYGSFSLKGKMVPVHRWCWERENGPIPDGLVIDHMCQVKACCNVDHLRVVTPAVNALENGGMLHVTRLQREAMAQFIKELVEKYRPTTIHLHLWRCDM